MSKSGSSRVNSCHAKSPSLIVLTVAFGYFWPMANPKFPKPKFWQSKMVPLNGRVLSGCECANNEDTAAINCSAEYGEIRKPTASALARCSSSRVAHDEVI